MQILHLYKDYFPIAGGIENHIKLLAEAQAARGHQVSVLVTSRDGRSGSETLGGVRVIRAARLATIASMPISVPLLGALRRERPDVTHLHSPYPWGEVASHLVGRARRTVLTYHSDIVRQRYLRLGYAPLMQRVLARVDAIIATSPNYRVSSPVLARWQDKCATVPLGIDPRPFMQVDASAADTIRARAGVRRGSPLLLFVGVLRYYKGLEYLLAALRTLPNVHLLVVGTGPLEREWKSLASALGIAERVSFAGNVADVAPFYAACDVFVLPSSQRSEAFGLVQLEAMAAGKPVVCTELGTGTGFVNIDGVTGFVVRPREAPALAAAISRLIADPGLRARMGAAGRARVLREFTADAMTEHVLALYGQLDT